MKEKIPHPDLESYSQRQLNALISVLVGARLVSGAVGVFAVTSVADISLSLSRVVTLPHFWASLAFISMAAVFTYWIRWFDGHTESE